MPGIMRAFEKFLDRLDLRVGVGSRYEELQGIGTEYLVKDGNVIAKFYNGKPLDTEIVGNSDDTLV